MGLIKAMVNGLPGNMAGIVAKHVLRDRRFALVPYSLTGAEIHQSEHQIDDMTVRLIRPEVREQVIYDIFEVHGGFISVDFTHPSAVNGNAEFYCKFGMPFVMGTTGGDREKMHQTVCASRIAAVIAPNMAKQIVGFQAMMEYAANTFPNLFEGYALEIRESHQKEKADTSGTAKAMTTYFAKLGVPVSEADIIKERNPDVQNTVLGVPQQYLPGHAWHTYTLISDDQTVRFEFIHNVNGRDIYAKGTLDALIYLDKQLKAGRRGKVFTMIDVLKGT